MDRGPLSCRYNPLHLLLRNVLTFSFPDMSSDLRTALTEEYANEERPSDGEVYRKIRQYRREKQTRLEMRWWTRISPHKASNLRQLLKHNDYTLAFDSFLELPALLTGLRMSTLHKMFAIRCDEVMPFSTDTVYAHKFFRRSFIISIISRTSGLKCSSMIRQQWLEWIKSQ